MPERLKGDDYCYSWAQWKKGDKMSTKEYYHLALKFKDKYVGRSDGVAGELLLGDDNDTIMGCKLAKNKTVAEKGEYLHCNKTRRIEEYVHISM